MKNLLTETEVTKVGMNHERDHLRVYLSSTRLIHKKISASWNLPLHNRFLRAG